MRVEPRIIEQYVADGTVSLSFGHVLDHGDRSMRAHRAAECAGRQSPLAFWQMHDLLFERQNQLWQGDDELAIAWAGEIGLETDAMRTCMADPSVLEKINRIDQQRRDQGIRLRPSFDINGQIFEGAIPFEAFVQLFDTKLASP